MPIFKRRGQLSLEFILLILGVLIAGTFVTLQLAEKSPKFLGNESSNIKKEILGLFVEEAQFKSNILINESENTNTEEDNINENINESENITIITAYSVSAENINICPTSSSNNNKLEIYSTNGTVYYINNQGDNNIGEGISGYATKIILRWKKGPYITLYINNMEYTLDKGFKKLTVIANDKSYPIEYSIYNAHESGQGYSQARGQYYLSFNGTNVTIYVERGNAMYILAINQSSNEVILLSTN
ncbi:class III signal peptide-containing protein [Methanocaldococcus sp. 16A]